ncbi:hypothetical protein QE152_g33651 [Popillia japonica]|uniref:Uncharacterized protein n=1 Tax=Popillia japonica TaxID=7064 RepID=A0AAW1IVH1_POPJA
MNTNPKDWLRWFEELEEEEENDGCIEGSSEVSDEDEAVGDSFTQPSAISQENDEEDSDSSAEYCGGAEENDAIIMEPSLTIFFNLLSLSGINAYVMYSHNNGTKMPRRQFLKKMGLELVKPLMQTKANALNLKKMGLELVKPLMQTKANALNIPRLLRHRCQRFLGMKKEVYANTALTGTVGKCFVCGRKRHRSTPQTCLQDLLLESVLCVAENVIEVLPKRAKWICTDHLVKGCVSCTNNMVIESESE